MADVLFGLLLSLSFLTSAWGWGQAIQKFAPISFLRLGAFAAAAGLAWLAFLGGLMNLAGLAKAPGLVAAVLVGAVLALVKTMRTRPWARRLGPNDSGTFARRLTRAWPAFLAGGVAGFMCIALVPSHIFNFHDDFLTYLPRVARMIESGSIAGNPFDGMGLDSLGSQSFFQGYFIALGGPRMANGFDAVCCLFLTLWLVAQLARAWGLPIWLQSLMVMAGADITPQCVNISPVYSSTLITLSLIVWSSGLATQLLRTGGTRHGMEVIGALLIATLVSLKVTVATFAAFHLVFLYLALFASARERGPVWKSALRTAVLAVVFVMPWALAHAPTIHHANQIAAGFRSAGLLPPSEPSIAAHDIPQLFSLRSLYYGDSLAAYHFLVLSSLAAAVASLGIWRRHRTQAAGLLSAGSAGFAMLGVYLLNAHMFGVANAVRYSVPALIAVSLSAVLCFVRYARAHPGGLMARFSHGCAAVILLVTIGWFGNTFCRRSAFAVQEGRALMFPVSAGYLAYCHESFSPQEAARAREWQQKIPAGAKVFAWTATPFHLDFARNELMTLTDPGLINPALHFPLGFTPEQFTSFLQRWNIEYVLIDVSGYAVKDVTRLLRQANSQDATVRKLAERGLYLRNVLPAVAEKNQIIATNDRTVLFKLPPGSLTNSAPVPAK